MQLNPFDIIVFVVFMVTVVAVGVLMSRDEKDSESYFLAGRGLSWWLIGFSLIAANISTEQFVGMSGSAADYVGLAIASYEWMAAITLVIVAFFFLPKFLRAGIYTIPEFLEYRYNATARTIMSFFMMIIYVFVTIAAVIYSGALTVDTITADLTTPEVRAEAMGRNTEQQSRGAMAGLMIWFVLASFMPTPAAWNITFLVYAGMSLAAALILYRRLPETRPMAREANAGPESLGRGTAPRLDSNLIKLMIAVAEGKKIGDQKPKIQDRLDAARWLADRGWGKPVQAMEHLGPGGILKQSEVVFYLPHNSRDHGSATKEIGGELRPIVPE